MNKTKIAKEILIRLEREYPDVKCHLEFNSPFELMISTVLAAQCTDERVNMVMVPLYKSKYKSPADILKDGISKFTQNIKSITFFNNKAKAIQTAMKLKQLDPNNPNYQQVFSSLGI